MHIPRVPAIATVAGLLVATLVGWTRHEVRQATAPPPPPTAVATSAPLDSYGMPAGSAAPLEQPAQPVQVPAAAPFAEPGPQHARRVRRNHRPESHSVAIVAGSAGVGAAIGALAGGGKGAGIGALSGGAAGFAYDRLTHNR